ncbi:MAG: AAA family ATPase [Chrysiogenales bacterium]
MKREIETKLVQMLDPQSPNRVIVIEGARQVGKSYLVNRVLQSQTLPVLAFDLEKKKRLRNQIDQTEEFADFQNLMFDQYGLKRPSILFFDEAQESLKLASYIRSFKEDWPDWKRIFAARKLFNPNCSAISCRA